MPVIPLDTKGAADPNATKSIDELIAEAEKNRPDVAEDELAMEVDAGEPQRHSQRIVAHA